MSKASRTALPLGSEKKLLAFAAGALPLSGEGQARELPTRLKVMPWGKTVTNKGELIVNETTLGVLAENQLAAKFDRVAFDFQHNTVKAGPSDEPVKVAGYGTPEVVEGEGIYLSAIEYTEHGRTALLGGDYPDISPTVIPNKAGEIVFLHSVGAVRQGEVDGLTLFEPVPDSKAALALAALSADGRVSLASNPAETDFRGIAIELLNAAGADLDDEADGSDILSAVARFREKKGAKSTSPTVQTMSADTAAKFEERLVALEAKTSNNERQTILDAAKREGKVIPLSADAVDKLDVGVLREMVEKLPAGAVPLSSETEGAADPVSLAAGGMTSADREVAKMLGVSEDDLKKYGAA